jgi:CRISPR-associated protein Csx16
VTTYFVTGHQGAIEWAKARGIEALPIAHLDPDIINAGDIVIGTLPVHLAAEVCERGGRYLHLVLKLKPADRRRELTAADMDALGAATEEFVVRRTTS